MEKDEVVDYDEEAEAEIYEEECVAEVPMKEEEPEVMYLAQV